MADLTFSQLYMPYQPFTISFFRGVYGFSTHFQLRILLFPDQKLITRIQRKLTPDHMWPTVVHDSSVSFQKLILVLILISWTFKATFPPQIPLTSDPGPRAVYQNLFFLRHPAWLPPFTSLELALDLPGSTSASTATDFHFKSILTLTRWLSQHKWVFKVDISQRNNTEPQSVQSAPITHPAASLFVWVERLATTDVWHRHTPIPQGCVWALPLVTAGR